MFLGSSMLYSKKNSNFPIKLFVAASLLALFLFVLLYLLYLAYSGYQKGDYYHQGASSRPEGKYYLNTDFEQTDPFITRNPSLEDMLAGPVISSADPSYGSSGATIDIVLFSDYTCSFCKKQEEIIKQIADDDSRVRMVRKDYPLSDPESDSFRAAVAARCAREQSAFWDYHDLLYSAFDFSRNKFISYAKEAGLDADEFDSCLDSQAASNAVKDNIIEANALNITGVPFLYINNQEVMGDISRNDLDRIIEIELNR